MPDNTPAFELSSEDLVAAVSPPDLRGRINLRIDAALERELENLKEDRDYPFKSVSEIVRYCCFVGLDQLRKWKPKPTLLGQIRSASTLLARDKIQCELVDLMHLLEERVLWYIENGHGDEVIDLVARVRSQFPEENKEFWMEWIRNEIDTKFVEWSQLIDNSKTHPTQSAGR